MIRLIHGSIRSISLGVAAMMLLAGCVANPTVDTSDKTAMTFDGLYPITGGSADMAWARPGVDVSQYSKIMLQGVGIEYRPGGASGKFYNSRSNADYFELTEQQKARFEKALRESFQKELAKSERFTIVNEPGPDVLLIRGGLLDVVSFVPPEATGRSDIYLSRVGEATLVLEIRDSISEAIIARAVDRRAAESSFGMSESNQVLNMGEVRRAINAWARLLRERLDTYGAPKG